VSSFLALSKHKRAFLAGGWILAVVAFASQWYLYDLVHRHAERVPYYLFTCSYLCGVLTPVVLWMGRRWYIDSRTWKRALPIHIAACLSMTVTGVFIEATIGWLPHASTWAYSAALRHYFTQHTQISVLMYWTLLGALHVYRMYDRARTREVRAAQLEAQLAEAQLAVLRTQLQPHFLFNTLQAATMLIYDDPEGAEEILLSLSELLRISLQVLHQQEVPLRREIEFLKHYAAIQQRRFGDRLRFEFEIEEGSEDCAVPSLLLQPLVENAIRHGIGKYKEADLVSIRAFVADERLRIEVENRASALADRPETLLTRGVGLTNTIARLKRLYGLEGSFAIRNLSPRGVLVSLSIPLRLLRECAEEMEVQTAS
jgi:two-component system LytT family sensor kinase